jgi:hydrogenase nickel incorporation protein HypB
MIETPPMPTSDAAERNRRALCDAQVLAVTLSGDAGAGKTALLEETLRRLAGHFRAGVIIANPKAERDARRLAGLADVVVPLRTAVLDAGQLHDALARADFDALDLLFIETNTGLSGRGADDLGQAARVAVFSVSGGDDKAAEFPLAVTDADLVLLNKLDLLPHVHFDPRVFECDVRRLNLDVPVVHVSAAHGTGIDQWERWLREQIGRVARRQATAAEWLEPPEVFLG